MARETHGVSSSNAREQENGCAQAHGRGRLDEILVDQEKLTTNAISGKAPLLRLRAEAAPVLLCDLGTPGKTPSV